MEFSPLTFDTSRVPPLARSTPNDPRSTRENPDRRIGGDAAFDFEGGTGLRNRKKKRRRRKKKKLIYAERFHKFTTRLFFSWLAVFTADSAGRKSIFHRRKLAIVSREESDTAKSNWLSRSHRRAQFVTHAKAN